MIKRFAVLLSLNIFNNNYAMNEITLITLPPEHWQEFRDLRFQALQEIPHAMGGTLDDERKRPSDFYERILKDEGSGTWTVWAEKDKKLIGMAAADCKMKDVSTKRHLATIVSVYVLPEFRNQGIGKKMMDTLLKKLEAAEQIRQVMLWVTTTQSDAIKLYEKCGFKICGKLECGVIVAGKEYHQLLMEKRIK